MAEMRHNPDLDAAFGVESPAASGPSADRLTEAARKLAGGGAAGSLGAAVSEMVGRAASAYGRQATAPPSPPSAGPGGADPDDRLDNVIRLLADVRDGIGRLVALAARGGGAGGPDNRKQKEPKDESPAYGWRAAFRPLTDWIGNTRLGSIGRRLLGRTAATPTGAGRAASRLLGGGAATGRATTSAAAGARGAAAAGGAEGGAMAAAGAAGPAGVVVAAAAALVTLARAAHDAAYAQEQHARTLAQFSPSQAANVQQLDVNRQVRQVERGEATAGTSAGLLRAIDKFERATAPLQKLADNLANAALSAFMDAVANLTELLRPIAEEANRRIFGETRQQGQLFGDWLKDVERKKAEKDRKAAQAIEDARRRAAGF